MTDEEFEIEMLKLKQGRIGRFLGQSGALFIVSICAIIALIAKFIFN